VLAVGTIGLDKVEGAVVLVVGGSSGIGLATALRLHDEGAHVVLCARDGARLAQLADRIGGRGGRPVGHVVADVLDADQVRHAVETVVADHGRIDAVVTSAQSMAYGGIEELPRDVFEAVVDTAVMGAFHTAQAVLPHFRAQRHGALVVVSSLLAEIAVPQLSAYCTAKWGQLGLVRSLQLEVHDLPRVSVSLVMPGAVDTPIYDQAATYAGRHGAAPPPVVEPDRVARAVVGTLTSPRRMVHVGPANWVTVIGYRLMPGIYDRLAPLLVAKVVLRGHGVPPDEGNVRSPRAAGEGLRGGWNAIGLRRRRR